MKWYVWTLLIVITALLAYSIGYANGLDFALTKAIFASNVLFDISPSPRFQQTIQSFPQLLKIMSDKDWKKMGINTSIQAYKDVQWDEINKTLTNMVRFHG